MYVDYLGLRREPFSDAPDPHGYVELPTHQEALAMLESVARGDRGIVCLIGDEGTGKSMLLRVFADRLHVGEVGVLLSPPAAPSGNLLIDICRRLGISISDTDNSSRALAKLRRRIASDDRQGRQVILMIDRVETLREQDIEVLRPLIGLQGDRGALLTTIFCGTRDQVAIQAGLVGTDSTAHQPIRCTLAALSREDSRTYLTERWRAAGGSVEGVFSPEALEILHVASGGIPRRLNRLADGALRAAVRADKKFVDQSLALEVASGQVIKARSLPTTAIAFETGELPTGTSLVDACAQQLQEGRAAETLLSTATGSTSITLSTMEAATAFVDSTPRHMPTPCGNGDSVSIVTGTQVPPVTQQVPAESAAAEVAVSNTLLTRLEQLVDRAAAPRVIAAPPPPPPVAASPDRLATDRPRSSQRRQRWSRAVERRLERLIDLAEQRIQLLEERAQRISESAPGLEDQAQRLESACERAARVETRLANFGEQLARQAARVQDGFALAAPDLEAIAQLQHGLQEDILRAAETRETLDQRSGTFKVYLQQLDTRLAEVANRQQQHEQCAVKAHETMETASRQIERLRHQAQVSAEHQIRLLEEAVERARRSQEQITDAAMSTVKAQADRLGEELTRRGEEAVSTTQQALHELHNQSLHVTIIAETAAARCQKDLDQRTAQAGQRQQQIIDESLARLQPLLAEVAAQQQKLVELRDVTLRAEHAAELLAGSTMEAQQWRQSLRDERRTAEEARDALVSVHVQAQQETTALVAQVDAAAKVSDQLAERHDAAHRLAEFLEQAARTHGAQADRAARNNEDLDRQVATAAETLQRISTQCEAARNLADDLERSAQAQAQRITEAACSASTLKTCTAEAIQAERHLRDTRDHSHATNDALTQSLRRGEEQVACIEKQLAALQTESASANRVCQQLAEADAAHPRRIEELHSAALAQQKQAERAATLLQTLQEVLPAAQSAIAQWSACRTQAEEVLAQLHSAVPTVKEAMQALVQRGETAESHLTRAVEQARQAAGELERWSGDAARLREETQRHMRLVSEKSAAEHRKLDDTALRLAGFEESLRQAVKQPHDILRQAATQAEQLEHVCAAVRKVFAGISQATLQARRDVQQLNQQRFSATDMLAQLQNATERNVETLQQWIEEAARAQSRLATTLRQVPPITATHPPVSLPRNARARDVEPATGAGPGRRANQSAMPASEWGGESRVSARAMTVASTARRDLSVDAAVDAPAEQRRASYVPDPCEVADLIEDARLAEERSRTGDGSTGQPQPGSLTAGSTSRSEWESAVAAVRRERKG